MHDDLPEYCKALDKLIKEIATENGYNPERIKELILKKGEVDTVAAVSTSVNHEHPPHAKAGGARCIIKSAEGI